MWVAAEARLRAAGRMPLLHLLALALPGGEVTRLQGGRVQHIQRPEVGRHRRHHAHRPAHDQRTTSAGEAPLRPVARRSRCRAVPQ